VKTQPYVFIFVHRDALDDARAALMEIANEGQLNDKNVRALQDVLDPLPEKDIFGITPGIQTVQMPDHRNQP